MNIKQEETPLYTIKEVSCKIALDSKVRVGGWIRSKRTSKKVIFIDLQDGSQQETLQLVGDPNNLKEKVAELTPGASMVVEGIINASPIKNGGRELQIQKIIMVGESCEDYPLQPKPHTMPFLRSIPHLRFRASTFRAVFRIRHLICSEIHQFFHEKGFLYLQTPIITGLDAEGAGELFEINTSRPANGQPFFGNKAFLTVSGQLAAEAAAVGLGRVYTFGPTFRAENSNTKRHLSEFWMVEPEMAFYNLDDTINLAQSLLKDLATKVLLEAPKELSLLSSKLENSNSSLEKRLTKIKEEPFITISYNEAINILNKEKKGTFTYPHNWGDNLQSEHESFLVKKLNSILVIRDYPKDLKAFYMRQNNDGKSVAAMDILLPGIGEVIGGSQREDRLDLLLKAIENKGIDREKLEWYLDTRRYGSVIHSGFGVGLERLVQFFTGIENIRDVIAFPRAPGSIIG